MHDIVKRGAGLRPDSLLGKQISKLGLIEQDGASECGPVANRSQQSGPPIENWYTINFLMHDVGL